VQAATTTTIQDVQNQSKNPQIKLEEIWKASSDTLRTDITSGYDTIVKLGRQLAKNEVSLNQYIRDTALRLEELWKRHELECRLQDICSHMCERLEKAGATKNIRVIVARQLDGRFKHKQGQRNDLIKKQEEEVTEVTSTLRQIPDPSIQSSLIFDDFKAGLIRLKGLDLDYMSKSDNQDLQDLLKQLSNRSTKYCNENKIAITDVETAETQLDQNRKAAKGQPITCPTPEGVEQKNIKSEAMKGQMSPQEVLGLLRTEAAKSIYKYAIAWENAAFDVDNFPALLEGDDEKIAAAFDAHRAFIGIFSDIKHKRDLVQWTEIVGRYMEVSKHNASSESSGLEVYGVSCKNCGRRMKPIDKKRDAYRLYYRCPNYYRLEKEYVGCKKDLPVSRSVSKERITEITPFIIDWNIDVWNTMPHYHKFLYLYRNYKQPYHTEHTISLEWKFQRRGV